MQTSRPDTGSIRPPRKLLQQSRDSTALNRSHGEHGSPAIRGTRRRTRARVVVQARPERRLATRAVAPAGRRAGHFPGHCYHSACTAARRSSGDRRAAPRPRRRRDPPLRRRRGRRRATSSSRAYGARDRRARAGALGAAPTPWWLASDGPEPWTTPRRDPEGLGRRSLTRAAWARSKHVHARLRRAASAPGLARRGPRPAGAAWARSLCCVCTS